MTGDTLRRFLSPQGARLIGLCSLFSRRSIARSRTSSPQKTTNLALAENVIGEAMAAELLGVSTWQLIEMLDSPPDDGDDSKPAGANRYPV